MSYSSMDQTFTTLTASNQNKASLIARILNYVRERIELSRAKNELYAMTDRELADIGILRTDIALLAERNVRARNAA